MICAHQATKSREEGTIVGIFWKTLVFFSFGKKRSDGFLGTCCVLLRTGGQRPAEDPLDGRCAWIEERGEREPGFDMPCTGVPGSFEQVEK